MKPVTLEMIYDHLLEIEKTLLVQRKASIGALAEAEHVIDWYYNITEADMETMPLIKFRKKAGDFLIKRRAVRMGETE